MTELRLQTADVAQQKQFYVNELGFALLDEAPNSITLHAGATRLIFEQAEQATKPFYHFAFNIPENQLASAKAWLAVRGVPPSQSHPDDWYSVSWNSHALYFYDPAGNIVEFIARHNLHNATARSFTAQDIVSVSEIGLVVDNVAAMVRALQSTLGLEIYQNMAENFAPLGDEHGLFIVVKRGRTWLASNKHSAVYPTTVTIQGNSELHYTIPDLPYALHVLEASPEK
ncbi:MAG: VOC family protein [Ktedonobacteraceae bacterium]